VEIFYNGVNDNDQDSLNAAAGGNLLTVEEPCVTCGGPHAHCKCYATNRNQPSVCVAMGTYNQVAPQNRARNYMASPGFALGMYHKKNVDFAYLLWEDFVYEVEHKDAKKSNKMYYPRLLFMANFICSALVIETSKSTIRPFALEELAETPCRMELVSGHRTPVEELIP
nr:hypothetical protein [Tanacetum cinerariifolium]